ncbi:MAG: CehA/McbA family metallohydrolase [Sandaracinaceae bacterium]
MGTCVALGCGETPDADAAIDAPAAMCETVAPFEAPPPEGHAEPLAAGPGEARAGRIEAADLPADRDGLATWRGGDYVLSNDRVALLLGATGREIDDPYPGRITGIARVEGGALIEPAGFNKLTLGLGRFLVAADAVGVVSDGADGGPAVIRARGPLSPMVALADLLDGLLPEDFTGLPGALEYELAPDANHVDVYLLARADEGGLRARVGVAQVFFQGFRTPPWSPGRGFLPRMGATPFVAFVDDDATSFAWLAPEGELSQLFGQTGIDVFTSGRLAVAPCGDTRVHVARLVIAGRGLTPLTAAVAELTGTETTRVSGTVEEADGTPAPDARLHVTTSDGEHLTRAWPAPDGTFSLDVDARATQLWLVRPGQPTQGPFDAGRDLTLRMPAFATIEVSASDEAGALLPVRVEVVPDEAIEPPPESWGEPGFGRGRSHVVFASGGTASMRVSPGAHRLRVTRGPEYERFETPVNLADNELSAHDVTLARVVDTTGVMCADYHIHTHRSVDSSDEGRVKLAGLAADGLEIAIRSEHEWVTDFSPLVSDLGLDSHVFGMAGLELTTFTYGHFGVFPLEADPGALSGGAVPWYNRLAPDVFADVRARPEAPVLVINHPRAGGLAQGYFTEAGYDPDTGAVGTPELWDDAFTVVEVFNDSDFESNRGESVRDWFSLLNSGRRVFTVGSSDSHGILATPVGYPRTCLSVGVDDVGSLTSELVRDATSSGRSYVSGGVHLTVLGPGGVGPGEQADGVGETARLDVTLRAAPRIDVDRLEVIVDGVTAEVIDVRPEDADPLEPSVRARVPVDVTVAPGGSWVVFHASGDETFSSHELRPFAVSNPVFLAR